MPRGQESGGRGAIYAAAQDIEPPDSTRDLREGYSEEGGAGQHLRRPTRRGLRHCPPLDHGGTIGDCLSESHPDFCRLHSAFTLPFEGRSVRKTRTIYDTSGASKGSPVLYSFCARSRPVASLLGLG